MQPDQSLYSQVTEFADPGGEATYFRLPADAVTVEDELICQR